MMLALSLHFRWFFRASLLLGLLGWGGGLLVMLAQAAPLPKAVPPMVGRVGQEVCDYQVLVIPGPGGTITPSTGYFLCGSTVVFTITPDAGYHIVDVGKNGVSQGATNQVTITNVGPGNFITATFAITTHNILPVAGAGGSIFPSTPQAVQHGDSLTFTIVPTTGYHIAEVQVDGMARGPISTYVFTNVTSAHTLSAAFAINLYTIIPTASVGGAITPSNRLTFTQGNSQTYYIRANNYWRINAVLVDEAAQAVPDYATEFTYTFGNLAAGHLITATFAPVTYAIYALARPIGGGAIIPNGIQYVPRHNSITFTLSPNNCFAPAGLQIDGFPVPYRDTHTFDDIIGPHSIIADYEPLSFRVVPIASAGGTILPATPITAIYGVPVPITFTAAVGHHLSEISVNGRLFPPPPEAVYLLNGVCDLQIISGTFSINTYRITATAGLNGAISPSGVNTVTYGSPAVFTITPNLGHYIEALWVDGAPQPTDPMGSVYTFTNVTAHHTLSATFVSRLLRVTVVNSPTLVQGRVILPNSVCLTACLNPYAANITVPLTAAISNGRFLGWGGACNSATPTCAVQVTATQNVTAYFGLRRFYLPFMWQQLWQCLLSLPDTDNNTLEEAQGPFCTGHTYQALPEDEWDWWYFDVPITGSITVTLANHTAWGPQLQLRDAGGATLGYVAGIANLQITCANFTSPNCAPGTPFPPGRYYVVVYTAGNYNTTPYNLTITYPAPPAP